MCKGPFKIRDIQHASRFKYLLRVEYVQKYVALHSHFQVTPLLWSAKRLNVIGHMLRKLYKIGSCY